jgi:hypothetical protein
MKKTVKFFVLAVMMTLCCQTMAQTRGSMFLGASFPLKDFAEFDGFNDFALTKLGQTDAGAGIGFNVGLKWYFNVGVEGLGVMLSFDGFYNGPNSNLKDAYRNGEGTSSIFQNLNCDESSYTFTPKYINVPAMLGMNYIYHFNPNLGIYVEAGAGGNLHLITDLQSVAKTQSSIIKITQDYDKAFSFAYQVGAGIEVAKDLVVGCSFYDLGNAEVKGDKIVKITDSGEDGTTNAQTTYSTFGTIHPIMVLGRIGFRF